jgi:hypothetical protein
MFIAGSRTTEVVTAMNTIARNVRSALPLIAGAIFLAAGARATSAEMADPARQSDMFKRIFSYDKDLRESAKIVVIIVGETRGGPEVDKVADVFREKGLFPAVITAADLSDDLASTLTPQSAVLYVMPGIAYDVVKTFAEKMGFLSISGVSMLAEAGHVAVSVGVEDGKPEIVVNMPRLTTERHELSSELLNLARVIR